MERPTILVGGVSELWQGDLDLGRVAAERLGAEDLGAHVNVEDLHYGALAVAQHLQDLEPRCLVLVGATRRGALPGTVLRRVVTGPADILDTDARAAVAEAATGYVSVDLVLEVGSALGALPPRTVAIEVEPATVEPGAPLSPAAERALEEALALARREVLHAPLLSLATRLRERLQGRRLPGPVDRPLDPSARSHPTLATLEQLLGELVLLDREQRFGRAFRLRDELRSRLSRLDPPTRAEKLDWALWWALIEELDRVQAAEATAG